MTKIITILGNSGSGKTLFSCILSKVISAHDKKAIIISPDQSVPTLPIILANQTIENKNSIGYLFKSKKITKELLAETILLVKDNPRIGVLGYCSGETPLSYSEPDYTQIKDLISVSSEFTDYIIIDCCSNISGLFIPTVIDLSNYIINILTPDLRGIQFYKSQLAMFDEHNYKLKNQLIFAGLARPYHAIDEMDYLLDGIFGILPFSKELDRAATEGNFFNSIKYCNKKYIDSVNKFIDYIKNDFEITEVTT